MAPLPDTLRDMRKQFKCMGVTNYLCLPTPGFYISLRNASWLSFPIERACTLIIVRLFMS